MWSADYICPIFYLNKLNDFVMYDKQFIISFTYMKLSELFELELSLCEFNLSLSLSLSLSLC